MRVLDSENKNLGVMSIKAALELAQSKNSDLIEIGPNANPPLAKIMDFGKYQYQEQKRAREARKHQKVIEVKEIKFRPKVDEHDYQFKKTDLDARQEKIGYKIREAQLQKVPYMLVVGDRESAEGTVSVRTRAGGDQGPSSVSDFAAKAKDEIATKKLSANS